MKNAGRAQHLLTIFTPKSPFPSYSQIIFLFTHWKHIFHWFTSTRLAFLVSWSRGRPRHAPLTDAQSHLHTSRERLDDSTVSRRLTQHFQSRSMSHFPLRSSTQPCHPAGGVRQCCVRLPSTRSISDSKFSSYLLGFKLFKQRLWVAVLPIGVGTTGKEGLARRTAAPLFPSRWKVSHCLVPHLGWGREERGLFALRACPMSQETPHEIFVSNFLKSMQVQNLESDLRFDKVAPKNISAKIILKIWFWYFCCLFFTLLFLALWESGAVFFHLYNDSDFFT